MRKNNEGIAEKPFQNSGVTRRSSSIVIAVITFIDSYGENKVHVVQSLQNDIGIRHAD